MSDGYTSFYLSHPVSIGESMACLMQSEGGKPIKGVNWWHKPTGKHYSPEVAMVQWEGRGGHIFTFELGIQRVEN